MKTLTEGKRRLPRRGGSGGGRRGGWGWTVVALLAAAIVTVWWGKQGAITNNNTIITSPAPGNNPTVTTAATSGLTPGESPAPTQGESESRTLTLKGYSLWGVQLGAYETLESAREAAAQGEDVLYLQERYRVLDSLWESKQQAQNRGDGLGKEYYASQLESPPVSLKLTGSAQAIEPVIEAAALWEETMDSLLQLQSMIQDSDTSRLVLARYVTALAEELSQRQESVPRSTAQLEGLATAMEQTAALLESVKSQIQDETVDLTGIFRYNVLECCRIYADYCTDLLAS